MSACRYCSVKQWSGPKKRSEKQIVRLRENQSPGGQTARRSASRFRARDVHPPHRPNSFPHEGTAMTPSGDKQSNRNVPVGTFRRGIRYISSWKLNHAFSWGGPSHRLRGSEAGMRVRNPLICWIALTGTVLNSRKKTAGKEIPKGLYIKQIRSSYTACVKGLAAGRTDKTAGHTGDVKTPWPVLAHPPTFRGRTGKSHHQSGFRK